MNEPTLDACFAKLARARTHMDELFSTMDDFNPELEIRTRYNRRQRTFTFTAAIVDGLEPPPAIGVMIGDWAHNARSALDQLVWQLVLVRGQRLPGRQHQFPIFGTASEYFARDLRMLDGLLAEDHAYIESIQPFREKMNGDISDVKEHFLWRLAWISNVDKHRLVHPAVTLLQSGARWDEQQPKEMFFPRNNDVATIDEIELFDPQLTTKHQPIARVRITPAGPDPLVSISDAAAILTITELELDIVDLHHILARIGFIFYRFAPLFGWKPGAPLPIPY